MFWHRGFLLCQVLKWISAEGIFTFELSIICSCSWSYLKFICSWSVFRVRRSGGPHLVIVLVLSCVSWAVPRRVVAFWGRFLLREFLCVTEAPSSTWNNDYSYEILQPLGGMCQFSFFLVFFRFDYFCFSSSVISIISLSLPTCTLLFFNFHNGVHAVAWFICCHSLCAVNICVLEIRLINWIAWKRHGHCLGRHR